MCAGPMRSPLRMLEHDSAWARSLKINTRSAPLHGVRKPSPFPKVSSLPQEHDWSMRVTAPLGPTAQGCVRG